MLSTDIVLIPPEQVRRRIEQVRQRFDTMWAGRVEGHISLIKPLPRHINPQEEMLLSKVFSKTEPFVAETTKLEMLSGERYYLVLGVKPHEPFVRLHSLAVDILGQECAYVGFVPHMTVGHFVSRAALEEVHRLIEGTFPECEFLVENLRMIALETETGRREERPLRLGKGS